MIPLALISAFASTDETRYILMKPRIVGDVIAATDGRCLVEVAVSEVEMEFLDVIEGTFPNYRNILDPEFDAPLVPMGMPELPDRPEVKQCETCHGQGFFECNCPTCTDFHDCRTCDGEGMYADLNEWKVKTGDITLYAAQVEKILALPNLKWFAPSNVTADPGPVRFTFGETGRGLIGQLKKATA